MLTHTLLAIALLTTSKPATHHRTHRPGKHHTTQPRNPSPATNTEPVGC